MSDKKTFQVVVRDVTIKIYEVEAMDTDEACDLVTDGEVDCYEYGDGGEWTIISVSSLSGEDNGHE